MCGLMALASTKVQPLTTQRQDSGRATHSKCCDLSELVLGMQTNNRAQAMASLRVLQHVPPFKDLHSQKYSKWAHDTPGGDTATYRVNGLHHGFLLSLKLKRVLPIRLNANKKKVP